MKTSNLVIILGTVALLGFVAALVLKFMGNDAHMVVLLASTVVFLIGMAINFSQRQGSPRPITRPAKDEPEAQTKSKHKKQKSSLADEYGIDIDDDGDKDDDFWDIYEEK